MLISEAAAKNPNVRLVAIAKDRGSSEAFARLYWPPPAEIYFDMAKEGYPFFRRTNGESQGMAKMLLSYLTRGQVFQNWKNANDKMKGPDNMKGGGASVLGSLIVVSRTGDILFHHKEKVVGDQPDPLKLEAAIQQLGETGVAACECGDDG